MFRRCGISWCAAVLGMAFLVFWGCAGDSVDGGADDGTAPAPVTDLAVTAFSATTVTLSWTASGDDSLDGTAARYEVRYTGDQMTWLNFDSAVLVTGVSSPKAAGQPETLLVDGLETDSLYYFALKVYDEENNCNGISNVVSATCFDDFVVTFADSNLLAAIRSQISKPTGDIMKSDLIDMFDLLADSRGISDLSGIQYCQNLHILNLYDNDISEINLLSNLSSLDQLYLGQNQITALGVLSSLPNLQWLALDYNDIVDITPLTSLGNLSRLNLRNNSIADIAPLVANAGLGNGDEVDLQNNPLSYQSINVHIPDLRDRNVTVYWVDNTVPPSAVTDLVIDSAGATWVALSWTAPGEDWLNGTAYQYEIRSAVDSMVLVDWSGGTPVSGVPAPDTAGTVQRATVTGLMTDTTYYFAMRTLDNSDNWSDVSNIVSATPYIDAIVVIPDAGLEAAIRETIGKPSGDIMKSDLLAMTGLQADNRGISDLTGIEYCLNMQVLDIGDNNVTDISRLGNLTQLIQLDFSNNNVGDIGALATISGLQTLQMSGNPISDISVLAQLPDLFYLSMVFVGQSDISVVANLTDLEYLLVTGNNISDLSPLAACTKLKTLFANANAISDISVLENMLQIQLLHLEYNLIVDILPLVNNAGLASGDELFLESNPLSTQSIDTYIPALQSRGVSVTF